MSVISDLFAGGIGGLLTGAGSFVKNVREAITGKSIISAEDQTKLLMQAAQLEAAVQQASAAADSAQVELNKIEAASPSFWKSGWRPGVGWVCVSGLAYQFLFRTIIPWIIQVCGANVPDMPALDMSTLTTLLFGMLGLGVMRTTEKMKGVS
jgi:hypothetical protein